MRALIPWDTLYGHPLVMYVVASATITGWNLPSMRAFVQWIVGACFGVRPYTSKREEREKKNETHANSCAAPFAERLLKWLLAQRSSFTSIQNVLYSRSWRVTPIQLDFLARRHLFHRIALSCWEIWIMQFWDGNDEKAYIETRISGAFLKMRRIMNFSASTGRSSSSRAPRTTTRIKFMWHSAPSMLSKRC